MGLCGVALAIILQSTAVAENSEQVDDTDLTQARLGVGVSALPEVLTSHLPEVIGKERGVLVSEVVEGSPADKAGLEKHDVLVRYGDQDLYSPEQLVKRVRNDQPGITVEIQYVRAGKLNTVEVVLGEQEKRAPVYSPWAGPPSFPWSPLRPEFWTEAEDAEGTGTEWTAFESMSVVKQPDGNYSAKITYRDSRGNSIEREFTGTRQEIRDAVQADKELPESRKQQLLRSLDDRGRRPLLRRDFFQGIPGWNRELFSWPNIQF